jgi:murein L,D-transpeptidase YcbB/YkuD
MSLAIAGRRAIGILPVLFLSMLLSGALPNAAAAADVRALIEPLGDAEAPVLDGVQLFSGRLLAEFYAERDYRAAWDAGRARAMLALAREGRRDAFRPDDFHAAAIAAILDENRLGAGQPARSAADVVLSDALLRYIHHFRFGKYNPRHINPDWIFVDRADATSLKADMALVLKAPDLETELAALLPAPLFYRNLRAGYRRYLEIADRAEWQPIPQGVNLTVGMRDPRVARIRERMAVTEGYTGDDAPDANADLYDDALASAVKAFQARSGLASDGVIGPNTLRAMNYPLSERIAIIEANLERMRWLYNELPSDYLFVDVAGFRLELVRDGVVRWTTPVIIGKSEAQTPMFRDEMEHLVFNPPWYVPKSIQQKMGKVDSRYQVIDRRTGREVSGVDASDSTRYRLVEPPGPRNALGRVKFMFPNGHAIYLHDTPSRSLFRSTQRAYSHGCVRVKEPLTLAEHVLNRPGWDQGAINRLLDRGKTRYIYLEDPLPVLLYYLTAVADDKGRVGFRRDVYDRDRPLLAMLDQPAHLDRIAFRPPKPAPSAEDDVESGESPVAGEGGEPVENDDLSLPAPDLAAGDAPVSQESGRRPL